jgi:SAM-dependent methyltransferase
MQSANTQDISPVNPCPVCSCTGAKTRIKIAGARDYLTGDDFSVLQCKRCQLAWTEPRPTDLNPYYPTRYRRYNKVIISILKTLYRSRVRSWSKSFANPGTALEMGCGDGFMMDALRELGWQVAGTERTAEMARFAREHFGLTVYVEDDQPIPSGARYDLIVLFQVLEHLGDPLEQIKRCRGLLKPGGRIVIGVPNFLSWQSRYAGPNWFHLDVPRHLFHHSPESMRELALAAGLKVDRVTFFSPEHDPYGWIQSFLNKSFCDGNRLTKLLMRMVKPDPRDLLNLTLAALLTPIAITLSLVSWAFGKGAIMQVELVDK